MTLTQTISRSGVLSLVAGALCMAVVMVRATWFCVRKYRPTNGELFLAYIALVLALVFFIVGCVSCALRRVDFDADAAGRILMQPAAF